MTGAGSVAGGNLLSGRAQLAASITLIDGVSGGLRRVDRNIARFERRLGKLHGGNRAVAQSFFEIGRGISFAAKSFAAFTGIIAVAGRGVAEFEQQISGVQAIAALTDDEISQIRVQAIDLSRDFAFSAKEIAEGQRFIAQTGAKTNEILSATPAILNLATSTLEEFDLAAKLTIKTLNAFRFSVGSISDVTRVVNDLQFAVNNSVNTLTTLNDALKFSAPFASTLGISLEDLITALQLTANAGLEAGIAGRSLGQGLQQLIRSGMRGAGAEAKAFSAELAVIIDTGGTLADVVQATTDKFGALNAAETRQIETMSDLSDAEVEAIESGEQLFSTTERLSNLIQVFGVRGARVFAVMLGQAEQMDFFREQMEGQVVSAAVQASVAMDNLADQTQIAFNKINAAVLGSSFGDILKEQIKDLNESGTTEEFGNAIAKLLETLAEEATPVLIEVLETLTKSLDTLLPVINAFATGVVTIFKAINAVVSAIPAPVLQAVVGFKLLNKLFRLNAISLAFMNNGFKIQNVHLAAALTGTRKQVLAREALNQVMLKQAAIGTAVAAAKASHSAAEIAQLDAQIARRLLLSKLQRAAIGVGVGAFALRQASTADSTRDVAGAAVGGAASGALIGSAISPVLGTAIGAALGGVGTLIWGSITKGINDKKAKAKAEREWKEALKETLEKSVQNAVSEFGESLGERLAFGLATGIQSGLDGLGDRIRDTLADENIDDAIATAIGASELKDNKLVLDSQLVIGGPGATPLPREEFFKNQIRIQNRADELAEQGLPGTLAKVLARAQAQPISETATSNILGVTGKSTLQLQGEDFLPSIIDAIEEATQIALEEDPTADPEDTARNIARLLGQNLGLSEAQIALLQNTAVGTGGGLSSITINQENQLVATTDILDDSVFDELISSVEKDGRLLGKAFNIFSSTMLRSDRVANATFIEVLEEIERVGTSAISISNNIQALSQELVDVQIKAAEAGKSLQNVAISVNRNMVNSITSFASFVDKNKDALADSSIDIRQQQEKLAKARAFEAVFAVVKARDEFLLSKQSKIISNSKLSLSELEVQRIQESIDAEIVKQEANRVYVQTLLEAAKRLRIFLPEGSRRVIDDRINQLQGQLAAAGTLEQNLAASSEDTRIIRDAYAKQRAILVKQEENQNAILTQLGLTEEDIAALDAETIKILTNAALATENMKLFSDTIGDIVSPAQSLGEALRRSQDSMISLGFSASSIDTALRSFQKVQFLNAQVQFLNNFKQLASATGASLSINKVIEQAQRQLLNSGGRFLEELLAVGSPEELSEIFARQNFLEQKVNNNTVINLQAELIFPEGITVDQREEISRIATEAVSDAVNDTPFRP